MHQFQILDNPNIDRLESRFSRFTYRTRVITVNSRGIFHAIRAIIVSSYFLLKSGFTLGN